LDYSVDLLGFSFIVTSKFDLVCTGNNYKLASTGACVPCNEIPREQIENMDNSERTLFESICLLDFEFNVALRIALLAIAMLVLVRTFIFFTNQALLKIYYFAGGYHYYSRCCG